MTIDDLRKMAIEKAEKSGTLEDIERAASVWKTTADSQKTVAEAATQKSSVRQEGLKQWAQLLVPLLSVLTLGVTIYTQTQQQRDVDRARQDDTWRKTIDEFKTAPSKGFGGLMAQVKLKPFLKSSEYGAQANQLARLVIGHIADQDAFRDLFESIKWDNLNQMAGVSRSLNHIDDEVVAEQQRRQPTATNPQQQPQAQATSSFGDARVQPQMPAKIDNSRIAAELDQERVSIANEQSYVCKKIVEAFRAKLSWGGIPELDHTDFYNCDMSKVDFSNATLNDAIFASVKVDDARFENIKDFQYLRVFDTAWWKAAQINAPLLKYLMENYDPGIQQDLVDKPTKDEYVRRVTELCKTANATCAASEIKFTEATAPPTK